MRGIGMNGASFSIYLIFDLIDDNNNYQTEHLIYNINYKQNPPFVANEVTYSIPESHRITSG